MATTTSTPALDALNADFPHTTPASYAACIGLVQRRTYAVGRWGSSYRGTSGAKLHLIRRNETIEIVNPARSGRHVIGSIVLEGCTSGNRLRTAGAIVEGLDLDAITCAKCRKDLDRMAATKAAR